MHTTCLGTGLISSGGLATGCPLHPADAASGRSLGRGWGNGRGQARADKFERVSREYRGFKFTVEIRKSDLAHLRIAVGFNCESAKVKAIIIST